LKERSKGDKKKARMTNGGAIAKRNDNDLAVDRVSVADGTLAHSVQRGASQNWKMNDTPLVISDPFIG
jgi:hypothetical protein